MFWVVIAGILSYFAYKKGKQFGSRIAYSIGRRHGRRRVR